MSSLTDRLNLQAQDWEITYKSHPANNEVPGYAWTVNSTAGGSLAVLLGWREKDMSPPTEAIWGWGLQTMIKDFARDVLKIMTLGRSAAMTMAGSTFSDNTLLLRGTRDSPVGNSFKIRVLDQPHGLDVSHFQQVASQDQPPGAKQAVDNSVSGKMALEIAELRARLADLEASRQENQGREKWNYNDVGPKLSNEALVGGDDKLARQGVAAIQAELGIGATRALVEKLPVRPSVGAWEHAVMAIQQSSI